MAQNILWKPYQLIDLSKIPDENLKNSLRYGIVAYTMKHIYEKDFLPAFKAIINNLKSFEKHDDLGYIYQLFSYIIEAGEIKKEEFVETAKTSLTNFLNEEKIMTLAEQFRQEGREEVLRESRTLAEQFRQEGLQNGLKKGKAEAFNFVAMKLFNRGMDETTIAAITGLSLQEITALKKQFEK